MNDYPSHLFAGRSNPRKYHRPLLCPKPVITPTTRSRLSFRGVVCLLSGIGVVLMGWVAYVEWIS